MISFAADIRYVESNSEEEWAQEATRLVQQAIVSFVFLWSTSQHTIILQGKKMAHQMQTTMATLEDTFANHAISNGEIPYNHTVSTAFIKPNHESSFLWMHSRFRRATIW